MQSKLDLSKLNQFRSKSVLAKFVVPNPVGPDYLFEGKLLFQHKSENGSVLIKVYESQKGNFIVEDKTEEIPKILVTKDWGNIFGFLGFGDIAKSVYRQLGVEQFEFV